MQKTVLSVSVAAALAVPGLALAQAAAPAAPTLDKVLEASGITMTGYVDAGYTHANRDLETGFSTRVFDNQNNSFLLRQVGVQIAKQPKEGVGGLVNVTAGKDAQVIKSFPDASSSLFDITQGFLQYATGPLTVIAGKFTTLHGTEVIWSPNNANISRSILFGSVPFTHTGVRGTYSTGDTLSFIAGLNNGWDQLQDTNKGKTLELGVTAAPIKPLSLAASYYGGQEGSPLTGVNGRRDSFNVVAGYTVMDPLAVGLEYLRVSQKDSVSDGSGGTKSASYSGIAAYVSATVMPKTKLSFRGEWFRDKDQLRFGSALSTAGVTTMPTRYLEYTLTLAHAMSDAFEVRGEVRQDRANEAAFKDGGSLAKSLTTFALQGLYKF